MEANGATSQVPNAYANGSFNHPLILRVTLTASYTRPPNHPCVQQSHPPTQPTAVTYRFHEMSAHALVN
jgi:hypothetical protein